MATINIILRCILLLTIFISNRTTHSQLLPEDDPSIDYYCGISWREANTYCALPCPSGLDTDCPPNEYGRARECFASSGCAARTQELTWYGVISLQFDRIEHLENTDGDLMNNNQKNAFQTAMMNFISNNNLQFGVDCVEVLEQEYDRPCVAAVIPDRELQWSNSTDDYYCGSSWFDASESCNLPCPSRSDDECLDTSGQNRSCFAATGCANKPSSTSLDLEVKMCGVYIPTIGQALLTPSDLENDILRIISNQEQQAIDVISSASPFFNSLTGVAAISNDMVAEAPSSMPSDAPTRPGDVAIETYIDANPSGSYGIFFSVRTQVNASTVLINGMSFVTPHNGMLEYEVYSRLGEFRKYEGITYEWDLIAKGQTTGLGPGEFTRVLDQDPDDDDLGYVGFTPVHILGDGGLRSFYLTMTKKYTMDDQVPVPISFSSSLDENNEGSMIYGVVASNDELEILEGDGVLDYPAPRNRNFESDLYYRRPRGFLGSFDYDRNPCRPTQNFYGWPCPYVPKKRPTRNPTQKPISTGGAVALNTQKPTPIPTKAKTKAPTTGQDANPSGAASNKTVTGDKQNVTDAKENDSNKGAIALDPRWIKYLTTISFIVSINRLR